MASITIKIEDTEEGSIRVRTEAEPPPKEGDKMTNAQMMSLQVIEALKEMIKQDGVL